jgi:hypothetical protein
MVRTPRMLLPFQTFVDSNIARKYLRRDSRSGVGVLADCGDGGGRGEQGGALGGGGGAQALAHGGAGAGVGHAVVEELVGPVCSDGHGLDFVSQ